VLRRLGPALLAALVAAGTVAWQHRAARDPHVYWDRFQLPAFDAWVYVAMAEDPGFFTLPPWGYRTLTPFLVKAVSEGRVVRGFRWVTLGGFALAGLFVFVFLRRLGHGALAALVAAAVFGLSTPIAVSVERPFLTDAATLALFVAFLAAAESGAPTALLALLMALGAFSKELMLLLVPLPALLAWKAGPARALVVTLALRRVWAPPVADGGTLAFAAWPTALASVLGAWREWLPFALVGGVTPLALVGALRRAARPFLARYGYLVALTGVLPFAASVYGGGGEPIGFHGGDVPRLLLYALPLLLALALFALDPLLRRREVAPVRWPRATALVSGVLLAGFFAWLPLGLDGYRRLDLRGPRDGPYVLGFCRETLRVARRLERGEATSFEPSGHGFAWGHSDPGQLRDLRWYLLDGWGPLPHYGIHDVVLRAPEASLVVPVLSRRTVALEIALEAPQPVRFAAFLNGQPAGAVEAGPGAPPSVLHLTGELLFRGDNVLHLAARGRLPGRVVLRRLVYRPGEGA
jgi:hypothetical protein